MVTSAPLWSVVVVPCILVVLAAAAVSFDALLGARAEGRPLPTAARSGPLTEVPRLLVAQRRTTRVPDAPLWRMGLVAVPLAGVLAALVIPYGTLTTSRMSVGLVWFNAMEALTWAALWMAGWGPNAPASLIGGYRYVAQALAYELPLMFTLISAATGAQSLNVAVIAEAQNHLWFVVWMPGAFVVYLASVYAFSFIGPLRYPAGADLAGGLMAELSGIDRLMIEAGRWLLLTAGAAMAVPLFLGGGNGPLLPAWLWSTVKTLAVLALLVVARRWPTVRADRYVELAWVVLIPFTIVQALVAALVVLALGGAP